MWHQKGFFWGGGGGTGEASVEPATDPQSGYSTVN